MNKVAVTLSLYKNDTISVVKETMTSLFNQSHENFDIFVQCDGPISSDLERYFHALLLQNSIHSFQKYPQNMGLAYSLNELIDRVLNLDYDYIFRMDADDICTPDRIKHQLQYLNTHPEVDILGGWIEEFNTDSGERQIIRYPQEHTNILHHMQKRNPMAHVSVAFRSSFFTRFGFYNPESKNEDFRLWVDAFKAGAIFHNLQEVLVKVRTNNAFYSRRKNKQRALEVMRIKFEATRLFGFGLKGYIYAVAHYLLFMSPGLVKQFIYKFFR